MDRFQYLIVLGACLVVTLPLELAFGARVWRQPRRLAIAVAPSIVLFTIWDLFATAHGTWTFDRRYTVGLRLPGGMVVEELAFFAVIPICALLTIEAVRNILAGTAPVQQWVRSR